MKTIYRLFAEGNSYNAVAIMFLAVLLWAPSFFSRQFVPLHFSVEPMPLYGWLSDLPEKNEYLSKVFAFILLLSGALLLNYLNTRYILVSRRSFLPSYFLIVSVSSFPDLQQLDPVLLSMIFLILTVHVLFLAYKAEEDSLRFFEAGMLLGTGSLFFAPLLWFIVFIWITTYIMRPFFWREWLYPLLGILVPYILTWGYYYVFLDEGIKLITLLAGNIIPEFVSVDLSWLSLVTYSYLLLVIFISSFYMIKVFQFRKVYLRIYFQVFFWLFISGFILLFYVSGSVNTIFYLIMIPASFLLTNYFIESKQSAGNRILFLFGLLLAILIQINEFFELL